MRKIYGTLLLCLVAACASTETARVAEPAHGRYTLQSINGKPLPVVLGTAPAYSIEYVSGELTLAEDSTYLEFNVLVEHMASLVKTDTSTATGRWSQSDTTVTLRRDGTAERIVATLKERLFSYRLVVRDSTYDMVYLKAQ